MKKRYFVISFTPHSVIKQTLVSTETESFGYGSSKSR